jgi:mevalonate kinase
MGEHAVVYGHPALVTAVDLRLVAAVTPASPGEPSEAHVIVRATERAGGVFQALELESTWEELADYAASVRTRWERYFKAPSAEGFEGVGDDDPAHLIKVAVGETLAYLLQDDAASARKAFPALTLEVESRIPLGRGMGSSAALAVSVVAGILAACHPTHGDEVIERLALEVERRQHGFPSGVDGSTVLQGGMVWAEPDAKGTLQFSRALDRSKLLEAIRVFDTGAPAESTGTVVAAVRERIEQEPERYGRLLDEMGEMTRTFRAELAESEPEPAAVIACIREYERALEELGVVPSEVRELIREIESEGGAAKISGAGALASHPTEPGGGAGCILVFHPDLEVLEESPLLNSLRRYDVSLGAPGLRLEAA